VFCKKKFNLWQAVTFPFNIVITSLGNIKLIIYSLPAVGDATLFIVKPQASKGAAMLLVPSIFKDALPIPASAGIGNASLHRFAPSVGGVGRAVFVIRFKICLLAVGTIHS
jgi:hypothetical protein